VTRLSRQTIIEFVVSGQFGQVNAIDVETGIEVAVIVPVQTSKLDRETLALKKLSLALIAAGIEQGTSAEHKNGGTPARVPPKKRGLIA
jgi:hypothetical protein